MHVMRLCPALYQPTLMQGEDVPFCMAQDGTYYTKGASKQSSSQYGGGKTAK